MLDSFWVFQAHPLTIIGGVTALPTAAITVLFAAGSARFRDRAP